MRHQTTLSWIAVVTVSPPWIGWIIHWQLTLEYKTVGRRLLGHAVIPMFAEPYAET